MRIDHVETRATGLICVACILATVACATGESIDAENIIPLFIDAGRNAHAGSGGAPESSGGGPSSTTGGVTSSGGNPGSGGRSASSGGAGATGGRTGEETPDGSAGGMGNSDSGASGMNGSGGVNTGGANAGGASTGGANSGGASSGGASGSGGAQSTCNPERCPSCFISGLLGAACCKSNDMCGCRPVLGLLPCN